MPGPPISHSYKYGQWTITDKAGVRRQVTISPPAASPEEEGATFKKDSQWLFDADPSGERTDEAARELTFNFQDIAPALDVNPDRQSAAVSHHSGASRLASPPQGRAQGLHASDQHEDSSSDKHENELAQAKQTPAPSTPPLKLRIGRPKMSDCEIADILDDPEKLAMLRLYGLNDSMVQRSFIKILRKDLIFHPIHEKYLEELANSPKRMWPIGLRSAQIQPINEASQREKPVILRNVLLDIALKRVKIDPDLARQQGEFNVPKQSHLKDIADSVEEDVTTTQDPSYDQLLAVSAADQITDEDSDFAKSLALARSYENVQQFRLNATKRLGIFDDNVDRGRSPSVQERTIVDLAYRSITPESGIGGYNSGESTSESEEDDSEDEVPSMPTAPVPMYGRNPGVLKVRNGSTILQDDDAAAEDAPSPSRKRDSRHLSTEMHLEGHSRSLPKARSDASSEEDGER